MLKNKENLLLTQEECDLIDAINCDNSSGSSIFINLSSSTQNTK